MYIYTYSYLFIFSLLPLWLRSYRGNDLVFAVSLPPCLFSPFDIFLLADTVLGVFVRLSTNRIVDFVIIATYITSCPSLLV